MEPLMNPFVIRKLEEPASVIIKHPTSLAKEKFIKVTSDTDPLPSPKFPRTMNINTHKTTLNNKERKARRKKNRAARAARKANR